MIKTGSTGVRKPFSRESLALPAACLLVLLFAAAVAGCGGSGGGTEQTATGTSTFSGEAIQAQQAMGINSPYQLISTMEPSIKQSLLLTIQSQSSDTIETLFSGSSGGALLNAPSAGRARPTIVVTLPAIGSQTLKAAEVRPLHISPPARDRGAESHSAAPVSGAVTVTDISTFLRNHLAIGYEDFTINLADGDRLTADEIREDPFGSLIRLLENGDLHLVLNIYPVSSEVVSVILDTILQGVGFTGSVATEIRDYLLGYYGIA